MPATEQLTRPEPDAQETTPNNIASPEIAERFKKLAAELADLGFVQILSAEYGGKNSAEAFEVPGYTPGETETEWAKDFSGNRTSVDEMILFLLLEHSLHDENLVDEPSPKREPQTKAEYTLPKVRKRATNAAYAYTGSPTLRTVPVVQPDFVPAPSISENVQGPQLPNLAFNDRVRPVSQAPDQSEFAAASQANEMYQRELYNAGWRGGETTVEQRQVADRAMLRNVHPDVAGAQNAEAAKLFNSSRQNRINSERAAAREANAQAEAAPANAETTASAQPAAADTMPAASAPAAETPVAAPASTSESVAPATANVQPAIAAAPASPAPAPTSQGPAA